MNNDRISTLKKDAEKRQENIIKVLMPNGKKINILASAAGVGEQYFKDSNMIEKQAVVCNSDYDKLAELKDVVVLAPPSTNCFWRYEDWHLIAVPSAGDEAVMVVPAKWRNGMGVNDFVSGKEVKKLVCRNFYCTSAAAKLEELEATSKFSTPVMAGKHLLADISVEGKKAKGSKDIESLTLNITIKKILEPTDKAKLYACLPGYVKVKPGEGHSFLIPGTKKFLNFIPYREKK